ncbi:MAG TPA: hypothetical protein VF116_15400 [Ktedonobacterales bacterium]
MSIKAAVARGYNFFVVATLGIVAGSLASEALFEDEWLFKLDELLIIAIGIVAIGWYLNGQHRYQRSLVPLALAAAAFLAKVVGLILEINDPQDVGDDFVMVQVLLLLVIVAAVAYYWTRTPEVEAPGTHPVRQVTTRVGG